MARTSQKELDLAYIEDVIDGVGPKIVLKKLLEKVEMKDLVAEIRKRKAFSLFIDELSAAEIAECMRYLEKESRG